MRFEQVLWKHGMIYQLTTFMPQSMHGILIYNAVFMQKELVLSKSDVYYAVKDALLNACFFVFLSLFCS